MSTFRKVDVFGETHEALGGVLLGMTILSGEQEGPSGKTWQDVARMTADRAEALARVLRHAANGGAVVPLSCVFPEPGEVLGEIDEAGSEFGVEVSDDPA